MMDSGEIQTKTKAYIVLNPIAGHSVAGDIKGAIERHFSGANLEYEIYETTGEEDVAEITRTACEGGARLVVAAGGDGTVAGAVNGLHGLKVPLGIVPVGTGNGLARALGIPVDVEQALALIAGEYDLICIDGMRVGNEIYTLNVSAGISGRAMREADPEKKRRFGILAYVWIILSEALGFQPRRFNLTIDGHTLQVRANEILVSNGTLIKEPPFPLGPRELYNDGKFDVYILTANTLVDYLKTLWNLVVQRGKRSRELRTLPARQKVVIEAIRHPQPAQADGESLGHTPVEIYLEPDVIQVIVPKKSEENEPSTE